MKNVYETINNPKVSYFIFGRRNRQINAGRLKINVRRTDNNANVEFENRLSHLINI
jgi:hypothetical protein